MKNYPKTFQHVVTDGSSKDIRGRILKNKSNFSKINMVRSSFSR